MLTMTSALIRAGAHFPGNTATIDEDGATHTWSEHTSRVARLAGALLASGLEPGDRFAILAPNSVRQCELIHAGYWSGLIPVPLNYRLAPPEIEAIVRASKARLLFVDGAYVTQLEPLLAGGWYGRVVRVDDAGTAGGLDGFSEFTRSANSTECNIASEDDEALLLYTGGTTGAGKGVPLTHKNIVSNGFQVGLAIGCGPDDLMLHVAPMFHSADLLGTCITLSGGAHSYLAAPSPECFIDAVEARRITYTMVPPILLHGVVAQGLMKGRDLSHLRSFLCGGAPVPFELLSAAQDHLPEGSMVHGYGLTETSPILTFMDYRQTRSRYGEASESCRSAGRPLAGVEVRVVDGDGQPVSPGEAGELIVRGPNVMGGYFDNPQANAVALRDGWFFTGDIVRADENGFLHVFDRKKDVVITGGENVYSAEVEAVLLRHREVSEAAVIGVPDAKYGEIVSAILVCSSQPDPADLVEFCRKYIGGYKIPRRIEFVDALPRSALGKVLKGDLRERFSA